MVTLSDLRENNIAGSSFAITGYNIHWSLGRTRHASAN
jgi:hypothetical protein